MSQRLWRIDSDGADASADMTSLKVLIEVDAALTEGDYDFSITKNDRKINRLLIQDEKLVAEYMFVF